VAEMVASTKKMVARLLGEKQEIFKDTKPIATDTVQLKKTDGNVTDTRRKWRSARYGTPLVI
jgi:hypothetical protein